MKRACLSAAVFALFFVPARLLQAQEGLPPRSEWKVPKPVPVPRLPRPQAARPIPEPTDPPAQVVVDTRTHVSVHLPAGWLVARTDGELSTFHLDARSAPPTAQLRLVANLNFNPFPQSTFAGALFYLSMTPHSSEAACAAQTSVKPQKPLNPMTVASIPFHRGLDEHGHICTEARVLTYTALREHSCLRFDLAVNTFCGGEDSGAQDITESQLASVFHRLESILNTLQFTDAKPGS